MRLYKLTDENAQTHGGCQWGEGVTHSGTGEGEMCGPGWVHAYTDPLLAVLLNPIHANFAHPRLWEAEGDVAKTDHGLKVGCRSLTTIREIPLPEVSIEQRVRFAVLCAQRVCDDPAWTTWADRWLSGEARSEDTERAADAAAWAAWAADAAWAEAAWAWAAARAARTADLPLADIAREAVGGEPWAR